MIYMLLIIHQLSILYIAHIDSMYLKKNHEYDKLGYGEWNGRNFTNYMATNF